MWPLVFNPVTIIDFYFIPFHFCLNLKWLHIDFVCYLVANTLFKMLISQVIFVACLQFVYTNHLDVCLSSVTVPHCFPIVMCCMSLCPIQIIFISVSLSCALYIISFW